MSEETVYNYDLSQIWRCGKEYMIYLDYPNLNRKIAAWKDSQLTAEYSYPDGGYHNQFRISKKKLEHAVKVLKDAEKDSQDTGA